jgi:hypothetical protein
LCSEMTTKGMNILEQYRAALKRRNGNERVTIKAWVEIGEEFVFGGYDWQHLGEIVNLSGGGCAKIIKIDSQGFKTAKRTK